MASQPDNDPEAASEARLRVALTEVADLAGLLDSIEARLSAVEAPAKVINRCLLASEEIVVNALRHGRENPDDEVVVELSTGGQEIVVTVTYPGIAFDPSDPKSVPPIDLDRVGGDGLRLVHQMVDTIRYARHGGRNTVILIQRREDV
jgi:anti-sigma regulatory factor (Ser/Thr protein kinase)